MLTGDRAYQAAVDRIWESAVHRRMYVTGGVGSTHQGEAFGEDYQLPNEHAYCESCAGCGLSFWADRMNRMHRDATFADVQERVLYNNVLGSLELSGENFYYQNSLSSDHGRYAWHGCPCCVGNIPRTLIAIKDLMYSLNSTRDTLYVNHFVASSGTIAEVGGTTLGVEQVTRYPSDGQVLLTLRPESAAPFTLKLRIPTRADSSLYEATPPVEQATIRVNGASQSVDVVNGYATISRTWKPKRSSGNSSYLCRFNASMPTRGSKAIVAVLLCSVARSSTTSRTSITTATSGPSSCLRTQKLQAAPRSDLLDGVTILKGPAKRTTPDGTEPV